jgi:hypothetical protein
MHLHKVHNCVYTYKQHVKKVRYILKKRNTSIRTSICTYFHPTSGQLACVKWKLLQLLLVDEITTCHVAFTGWPATSAATSKAWLQKKGTYISFVCISGGLEKRTERFLVVYFSERTVQRNGPFVRLAGWLAVDLNSLLTCASCWPWLAVYLGQLVSCASCWPWPPCGAGPGRRAASPLAPWPSGSTSLWLSPEHFISSCDMYIHYCISIYIYTFIHTYISLPKQLALCINGTHL